MILQHFINLFLFSALLCCVPNSRELTLLSWSKDCLARSKIISLTLKKKKSVSVLRGSSLRIYGRNVVSSIIEIFLVKWGLFVAINTSQLLYNLREQTSPAFKECMAWWESSWLKACGETPAGSMIDLPPLESG